MIQNNNSPEPPYVPKPGKGCGWTMVSLVAVFVAGVITLALKNGCNKKKAVRPIGVIAWKAGDSIWITPANRLVGNSRTYYVIYIGSDTALQRKYAKNIGRYYGDSIELAEKKKEAKP